MEGKKRRVWGVIIGIEEKGKQRRRNEGETKVEGLRGGESGEVKRMEESKAGRERRESGNNEGEAREVTRQHCPRCPYRLWAPPWVVS